MVEVNNNQQTNKNLVNNSQFAGMIFVGIKKAEYVSRANEDTELYEDVLEAIENKIHGGKLMLGFFSVSNLVGENIEKVESICNFNTNVNENMLRQTLKKVALIDYAEAVEENSNEINVIIVADCIIHWDSKGSYIQPTDEHSYLFDLEDILGMYPSSYKSIVYTNRDLSAFKSREIEIKKVTDVPIMQSLWYNQPSFQQVYGNYVLLAGFAILAIVYGLITWQKGLIEELNTQISGLNSVKVDDSFYKKSSSVLTKLNQQIKYKDINNLVLKDISTSLNKASFKLSRLYLAKEGSDKMVITIISKLNKYTQFGVQETLAREIIDNTSFVDAIRKKVTDKPRLELEALVDLNKVRSEIVKINKGRK